MVLLNNCKLIIYSILTINYQKILLAFIVFVLFRFYFSLVMNITEWWFSDFLSNEPFYANEPDTEAPKLDPSGSSVKSSYELKTTHDATLSNLAAAAASGATLAITKKPAQAAKAFAVVKGGSVCERLVETGLWAKTQQALHNHEQTMLDKKIAFKEALVNSKLDGFHPAASDLIKDKDSSQGSSVIEALKNSPENQSKFVEGPSSDLSKFNNLVDISTHNSKPFINPNAISTDTYTNNELNTLFENYNFFVYGMLYITGFIFLFSLFLAGNLVVEHYKLTILNYLKTHEYVKLIKIAQLYYFSNKFNIYFNLGFIMFFSMSSCYICYLFYLAPLPFFK